MADPTNKFAYAWDEVPETLRKQLINTEAMHFATNRLPHIADARAYIIAVEAFCTATRFNMFRQGLITEKEKDLMEKELSETISALLPK